MVDGMVVGMVDERSNEMKIEICQLLVTSHVKAFSRPQPGDEPIDGGADGDRDLVEPRMLPPPTFVFLLAGQSYCIITCLTFL
jgi:hypothetical protein